MKLPHADREIDRNTPEGESTFTCKVTAHTFAVLSSALYSNKIAAPIRELLCNAYDSHVAAGKADVPVELTLPTIFEPVFMVRDFGVGLSNDDVMHLYTTYFESTKQDDNDQIGALGLGSKSPFAYVSSFTVESRFNGLESSFAMFIDENGLPRVTPLVLDVPTTESNGLTVSFAVDTSDTARFLEQARRILMYFPVQPKVLGRSDFEPYSLVHKMGGTGWKVREATYSAYMSGPYVIHGPIAYPLKTDILEDKLSMVAKAIAKTDLDLFFPLGAVSIAPSREALGYDKRTIDVLVERFEQAASELRVAIQGSFTACNTLWEARTLLYQTIHGTGPLVKIASAMHKTDPFTYNGQPISLNLTIDRTIAPSIQIDLWITDTKYGRRKSEIVANTVHVDLGSSLVDITIQKSTTVIIDDLGRSFNRALKEYMCAQHERTDTKQHVIALRVDDTWTGIHPDHLAKVLTILGVSEAKTASDLGLKTVVKARTGSGYYKPRGKAERLVFTGFPPVDSRGGRPKAFSRLTWNREEIDLDAGGFYVEIERFTMVHPTANVLAVDRIQRQLRIMDSSRTYKIVGFTQKEISATDMSNWTNFFDFALQKATSVISDPIHIAALAKREARDHIDGFHTFLNNVWPEIRAMVQDGMFKTFCDEMASSVHDGKLQVEYSEALQLANRCGLWPKDATIKFVDQSRKTWAAINNMYGLLPMLDLTKLRASNWEHFVTYLNSSMTTDFELLAA